MPVLQSDRPGCRPAETTNSTPLTSPPPVIHIVGQSRWNLIGSGRSRRSTRLWHIGDADSNVQRDRKGHGTFCAATTSGNSHHRTGVEKPLPPPALPAVTDCADGSGQRRRELQAATSPAVSDLVGKAAGNSNSADGLSSERAYGTSGVDDVTQNRSSGLKRAR